MIQHDSRKKNINSKKNRGFTAMAESEKKDMLVKEDTIQKEEVTAADTNTASNFSTTAEQTTLGESNMGGNDMSTHSSSSDTSVFMN